MSPWAVIGGALAAGVLAWAAIATVAWLGQGSLDQRPIRWLGAAALALLALDLGGAPVHWALPPALLAVGLAAGVLGEPAGGSQP